MKKSTIIALLVISSIANAESKFSIIPTIGMTISPEFIDNTQLNELKSKGETGFTIGADFLYGKPTALEYGLGFNYHKVDIKNNPRFKSIDNKTLYFTLRYTFDINNQFKPFIFGNIGANFPDSDGIYELDNGTYSKLGAGLSYNNFNLSIAYNKYDYDKLKAGKFYINEKIKDDKTTYDKYSIELSYRFNLHFK